MAQYNVAVLPEQLSLPGNFIAILTVLSDSFPLPLRQLTGLFVDDLADLDLSDIEDLSCLIDVGHDFFPVFKDLHNVLAVQRPHQKVGAVGENAFHNPCRDLAHHGGMKKGFLVPVQSGVHQEVEIHLPLIHQLNKICQ